MLAETRHSQILAQLAQATGRTISVVALSQQLDVSEMTIRRDLDWLAEQGQVVRIHGGALLAQAKTEKPLSCRLADASPQKQAIGQAAAQLVADGDRIILDAGTTIQQVAHHLASHRDLTVITNNLPVAEELMRCPSIEIILLGGSVKQRERCTIGPMVTQALAQLSVDKLFLSVAGFSLTSGMTDQDWHEVEVKQAMIRAARQVVLVADSSKFGITHLIKIAQWNVIHTIVTDNNLPAEAIGQLESAGMKVYLA